VDSTSIGLVTVAIGQLATIATIAVNAWVTGLRADQKARREDELAARDRRWLIEDRAALAVALAAKVEANAAEIKATAERTAAALAIKVAADAATMAAATQAHVQQIVDSVADNTRLTVDVGKKAEAAYQEANSVNLKLKAIAQTAAGPLAEHLTQAASEIEHPKP